jgi:hypothetical protein
MMRIQKSKSLRSTTDGRASRSRMLAGHEVNEDEYFCGKKKFHNLLNIEKMRSERSQKPLTLMIIDIFSLMKGQHPRDIQRQIKSALDASLEESDIRGWYNYNEKIGIIFDGTTKVDSGQIGAIIEQINDNLSKTIDSGLINKISFSFHVYPSM